MSDTEPSTDGEARRRAPLLVGLAVVVLTVTAGFGISQLGDLSLIHI